MAAPNTVSAVQYGPIVLGIGPVALSVCAATGPMLAEWSAGLGATHGPGSTPGHPDGQHAHDGRCNAPRDPRSVGPCRHSNNTDTHSAYRHAVAAPLAWAMDTVHIARVSARDTAAMSADRHGEP